MKKENLLLKETGLIVYKNEDNTLTAISQRGWNWFKSIQKQMKDVRSQFYGYKKVYLTEYSDYINGEYCGQTQEMIITKNKIKVK